MRALFAISLMVLPAQGFAAPANDTAPVAQPAKKICRVDPADIDSRIRRRICKTEAEWNGTKGQDNKAAKPDAPSQGGE